MTLQDQNASLDDGVKCEESELNITEDMDVDKCEPGQDVKVKKVRKGGRLRTFKCLACGQKFRGRGALIQHQREKHVKEKNESVPEENIITCSTPAEKLPETSLSMQHSATYTPIDTEKNSGKKHLCDQCGKRFAYESFLKAHQKVHEYGESALPPFLCHLCPRRFGYKVALVAHLRRHVRKTEFVCPICEKSLPSRSFLAEHIKASHATKKLFCKTCNSSFSTLNGYLKHMEIHNKVTAYYCEICKIYLTQKDHPGHMVNHEKKSVSEEPVASTKIITKRGRKKRVLEQQNNSEEGSAPGIGSDSEPVTARQEEAEMELPGEAEASVLDETTADPSELEAVESEAQILEKELSDDNHEEEKSKDDALTE